MSIQSSLDCLNFNGSLKIIYVTTQSMNKTETVLILLKKKKKKNMSLELISTGTTVAKMQILLWENIARD